MLWHGQIRREQRLQGRTLSQRTASWQRAKENQDQVSGVELRIAKLRLHAERRIEGCLTPLLISGRCLLTAAIAGFDVEQRALDDKNCNDQKY